MDGDWFRKNLITSVSAVPRSTNFPKDTYLDPFDVSFFTRLFDLNFDPVDALM